MAKVFPISRYRHTEAVRGFVFYRSAEFPDPICFERVLDQLHEVPQPVFQ